MLMRVLALLFAFAASCAAHAQIYECVDANGAKRFTNIKSEAKGCRLLDIGPINTVPAPKPQAKTGPGPAAFPKVDAETQRQRDGDRRRILEQELANEQKLLAAAQKELTDQAGPAPAPSNPQLEPYRKRVKLHEDNIESLKRELANLR